MLRKTKDKVYKKNIFESKIRFYKNKIEETEEDFMKIIKSEIYEREIRKAEMEAQKAENLMKYSDEIYNRPKK